MHVCMYVRISVCICIYMYVCMYLCPLHYSMLLRYATLCPLRYTLRYLTRLVRDQPV